MPATHPQLLRALQATRSHPRAIVGHRFASHGAPHYNEPGGWLFGEKPLPPGQKRVKEDWENIWYVGMFGTMLAAAVLLYYKPDTSIQTWALKEAKQRMEARGEKYKYEPPSSPPSPSPS
ncbi:hypothetical protein PISMIDRAFT_673489 [Pisolithus microcarpus 441]|uniref:NADH dehydrogenase [ubiquinone] 1 beta subcomplex subunit 11, mitochondrial n=1 Tax=Pisolithus microcarpus 441 TaxID=765257 RepID=A0A0C9ZGZ3_9AGAM|nr:Ndufb11, NADH dehydrogenase 1 beta subcomplex subunit [Pisolithus microcarpus]KIK28481.1 hypothetical protein PISMIDRAFT_673489 [Pisolithus microcarpus 441]